MKLVFVQKQAFPLAGVASISAYLKSHGHQVDLFLPDYEKDIFAALFQAKPEIIAIPCFTGEHLWASQFLISIKKRLKKTVTVLGGPHPTYYPEVIYADGIDIIVRGEAEEAMLELLEALRLGKSTIRINNLWVKKNGRVYKNDLRPLIADLDKLPFPDRSIYYKYSFLRHASVKQFLTARGCPYACSFCSNHLLRKMYRDKGLFLRRRSPENVIAEMVMVKGQWGFKTVSFTDDVFATDFHWLEKFLPEYKKQIGVPFMANVTANLVNAKLVRLLKKGGCYGLAMGIESGSQKIRCEFLKKNITNKQIIVAGRLIKKNKLKLKTYNILCLPGETLENAWETVNLNIAIGPDSATASLLQPYPGYEITEYALQAGFLPKKFGLENMGDSIYTQTPIEIADKEKICNLQSFFPLVVKMPLLSGLVNILIGLPAGRFYRLLGKFFYGLSLSRVHRLTFLDIWRYGRHLDPFKV